MRLTSAFAQLNHLEKVLLIVTQFGLALHVLFQHFLLFSHFLDSRLIKRVWVEVPHADGAGLPLGETLLLLKRPRFEFFVHLSYNVPFEI